MISSAGTGATSAASIDRASGQRSFMRRPAPAASYAVERSSGTPSATHSQRAAPSPS